MDSKKAHDLACAIISNPYLFKEFESRYLSTNPSELSKIRVDEFGGRTDSFTTMYKTLVKWLEKEDY